MIPRAGLNPLVRMVLVASGIMLACALAVDFAFTRGQFEAKKRLLERRERLVSELRPIQAREHQIRGMAEALGAPDLASAIQALREEDPVSYLGRMVSSAGLVREEMVMEGVSQEGGLRRTRFYLRVQGGYPRILALVQRLEESARLVSIDAMAIGHELEDSGIEGRLNVSVYSP